MFLPSRFLPLLLLLTVLARAQTATGPAAFPEAASAARPVNASSIPPAYKTPYPPASPAEIKAVLDRVQSYLEVAGAIRVMDRGTNQPVDDQAALPAAAGLDRTDFWLTSYEWGVTYSGMLQVAEVTGDGRFRDYVNTRLDAVTRVAAHLRHNPPPAVEPTGSPRLLELRNVLAPRSLDDSGSMAAAMIKAHRMGILPARLRPWIDNYLGWIRTGQYRFPDGTLARNRPMANSLWLDDLYMSVPALAQMAALTRDRGYFDDAAKQILQFSRRMFVPENGLYRHGWVEAMDPHPAFHWARANGWAILAMAELLSVLPEDHPQRAAVLGQYRAHVAGLSRLQHRDGLWHQLLDRPDSYLETSASAMFVYALARGINRGWIDGPAYGPVVSLGWNAVAQQVNTQGQVENTCVGTGMAFDPAFYYYRPVSVYAAHGYGPVLLAGAEMIALRTGKGATVAVKDRAVHFAPSPSLD